MRDETERDKRAIQRWSRLAIQLNGAADSGRFDHLTTRVIVDEIQSGDVFALLTRELPPETWAVSKLDDVDRHDLAKMWMVFAKAYEPKQFHVERRGLALLVSYLLHSIDTMHSTVNA